jgi:hypothetical protein
MLPQLLHVTTSTISLTPSSFNEGIPYRIQAKLRMSQRHRTRTAADARIFALSAAAAAVLDESGASRARALFARQFSDLNNSNVTLLLCFQN